MSKGHIPAVALLLLAFASLSLACTRGPRNAVAPQRVCTLDLDTTDLDTCRRECDSGNENSCLNLGIVTAMQGNPTKGQQALLDSCGRGFHIACGHAANIALKGTKDAPPDPAKAAPLFSMACENGDGASCYELGKLVSSGTGVPANATEALKLYEQACNANVIKACEALQASPPPPAAHEPQAPVIDSMD